MTYDVRIGEAIRWEPSDYKALNFLSMEINGKLIDVLIGTEGTDIGIDIVCGGDCLQVFDPTMKFYRERAKASRLAVEQISSKQNK